MPKLSVVVPVYNAKEYLLRCTDSILNQTFKDLELILVDDCSKDDSFRLPRIRKLAVQGIHASSQFLRRIHCQL